MINISSFKTTKTTNPYNETDEVLELNINDGAVYRLNNVIKVSGTYTFSIWYKTNKNTTITLRILGNESQISSGTSWKKFVKTITVNSVSDQNSDIDIEVASGAIGYFYEAYLSEGVSDTSWSPAPEDIDDNIESIKSEFTQTAEEIKMSVKNIKGDVSNLNIQVGKIEQSVADNKGNISSLTTTVSGINTTVKKQGESISNIDQKADKISQQVTSVKSELNSKIELTAGEISQKVDDVRADLSSEIKQTSDKISQTVTDMNNNLSTRIDQTAKDIELNASKTEEIGNSLNNLEIGGRNLLLNTGFNTFNHWIKGGNAKSLQMVNGWCEVTIGGRWSGFVQEFIPEKNVEYIVSYEAYLVDTVAETAVLETDFGTPDQNQTINKTPAKYSLKLKYPSTSLDGNIDFKLSSAEVGKKWRIRKIKLEKGNKATDWSPAPEDVNEKIDDIQIGGRNILKNSKNGIVCTGTDYSSTTTPGATITTKATGIGNAHGFIEDFYTTPVSELSKRVGTEFAFSLDVKITGSFTNLRTKVDFRDTSHNSSIFSNFIGINGLEVGKWTRVSGVASVKGVANVTATRSLFLFDWSNSTVGSTIEYRNLQLEEGNKSTAWTPAPEDIENELTNNYYNKTQMESKLQIQSDNITANVKKEVTTIKNDLDQNYYNKTETDSKIKLSSDNINLKVEKVEETAQSTAEDLTNYINLNKKELENLQSQIDGSIMTWFYSYVPTNSNKPAVDWNTVDLKNNHLGDLFYDTTTGYCYRWQVQSNQYSWSRVTDVDVTKALSDAAKAQDTADAKRRVFVTTPKPPYEVGDLWVQGTSGDIMRCKTAKTSSQSYSSSDWDKASKYTDDTTANGVKNDLKNNYYTKTQTDAAIDVSADSITSTVKKEITTQIDSIEIGTKNILLNSSFTNDANKWSSNNITPEFTTKYGRKCSHVKMTALKTAKYYRQSVLERLEPNTTYTMSGWVLTENIAKGTTEFNLMFYHDGHYNNNGTDNTWYGYGASYFPVNTGTGTWHYQKWTFITDAKLNTATGSDMYIFMRDFTGDVYFSNLKLEKGNKATDWSPAPEDLATADSLADVNNSLTDATNDLQSNINSTNKNLQDIQNSQNEVYEIVSQNKSQISSLTQRAEGFSMDFKTVNETVKQINNQFVTERDERYKYIKFIDGEIWLGKEVPIGEDDFKLVIKNDRISFLQNKTEVAYMSNNKLYVTDIHVTNTLQLGQFVWASRANGNVGLRWIGN